MEEKQAFAAPAEAMGVSRATERTGMYTTALVGKVGARTICLDDSSRSHAGEHLQSLLRKRQVGQDRALVLSDALARKEADEGRLIRCHGLAHGRRTCSDREEGFPLACQMVFEALKQVFEHDEVARKEQRNARGRLVYHQEWSRPIMDGRKAWLKKQFDDRLVEPNSSLGKAISYRQGHWETLTRFLQVPGAPLENNGVERALKRCIRQRKNSLFSKTPHSASIARVLTSVIATCLHAGVYAVDYLVALQEHRREVFAGKVSAIPWSPSDTTSTFQKNLV